MNFNSKRTSLIVLGITSLIASRAFYYFVHDPEGPNLLIVVVLAAIIYLLSTLAIRHLFPNTHGPKGLLSAIGIQILFFISMLSEIS